MSKKKQQAQEQPAQQQPDDPFAGEPRMAFTSREMLCSHYDRMRVLAAARHQKIKEVLPLIWERGLQAMENETWPRGDV